MKKRIFLIILAGFFIFSVLGQNPPQDKNWQLHWADEFDFFNGNIWWCSAESVHNDDANEIYVSTNRPENVSISNGNLVLQALKEEYWYKGKKYEYTAGRISTGGNHNVRYGYIEGRIKLPYGGQGIGTSFWTWNGGDYTNFNAAEIDIFEMIGHQSSTTMGTNLHMYYCPGIPICTVSVNNQLCPLCDPRIYDYQMDVTIPSYANTYRTYAIEWNKDRFIWYVDGVAVRNFPNPGIVDYVRIILGIGLIWWAPPNSTTVFPAKMEVDYVKVWKLECDGKVVNEISNYNTFNYAVKKSISLSGISSLTAGEDVSLRATDFIELNAGFEVPAGAELYLDINPCDEERNIIISQNHPNPFYDITTIECYISKTVQKVQFYVYNMDGTLIKKLDIVERGTINIQIHAKELPSAGTYIYLLKSNDEISETMQMILTE